MWQAIGVYLLIGVLLLSYSAIQNAAQVDLMFDEADREADVSSPPIVRLFVLCAAILILSPAWPTFLRGGGDDA